MCNTKADIQVMIEVSRRGKPGQREEDVKEKQVAGRAACALDTEVPHTYRLPLPKADCG